LHEDAVHARIVVQLVDQGKQLRLRRSVGEAVQAALHADFFAVAALVADVDLAGRIVAHEHGGERRRRAPRGDESGGFFGELPSHLLGKRCAVEELGGHGGRAERSEVRSRRSGVRLARGNRLRFSRDAQVRRSGALATEIATVRILEAKKQARGRTQL
jgi:hypothetical protein